MRKADSTQVKGESDAAGVGECATAGLGRAAWVAGILASERAPFNLREKITKTFASCGLDVTF
jgi:hypothetical protein